MRTAKTPIPVPGPVLLLGGRSEIGMEIATRLARATAVEARTFILAARRSHDLGAEVARLTEAGAQHVVTAEFDADDVAAHPHFFEEVARAHGVPALAVFAFGILGEQDRAEEDSAHTAAILHTDFIAQATALIELAKQMRYVGRGQLVVFSSVAGIRVRRANFVYGSAKAGLDGFASGLADSLARTGVRLLLVRPGFVIGKMTEGLDPAPLSSTPDQVADAVVQGLRARRRVLWVPGSLRALYAVARVVPQPIWRRLPR
nr:SDR family NAD(P)-dependent oxidoreductase [Tomitella biformata]